MLRNALLLLLFLLLLLLCWGYFGAARARRVPRPKQIGIKALLSRARRIRPDYCDVGCLTVPPF